jgi:hypothetical protein
MVEFINKTIINDQTIFYKELKVKHLKIIYKTLFGDDPDPETVFTNFNNILTDITNLSQENLQKLNFLDYFLLLLDIRSISIGNVIFARAQENNLKIEINISKIKDQIENLIVKFSNSIEQINDFSVLYGLPTVNDLMYINQQTEIDTFYSCFIKQINTLNTKISFENFSTFNKNYIFEQLPAKTTSSVIKKTLDVIRAFNSINLLSYLPSNHNLSLTLNFNIKNNIIFLKLLFGNELLSLYENIFALCKVGNFTPEYIENCTPGEYLLLIKKLEQLNAQSSTAQTNPLDDNDSPTPEVNNEFDDLNPYKSPDLPPITSKADLNLFS